MTNDEIFSSLAPQAPISHNPPYGVRPSVPARVVLSRSDKMFELSFGKMMIIAVVALIVLGPEKLPKVARTLRHLLGRARSYANPGQAGHRPRDADGRTAQAAAAGAGRRAQFRVGSQRGRT